MVYVAGIDLGSRVTKAVVLDEHRRIRGRGAVRTRTDFPQVARAALAAALADAEISEQDIVYAASTGFGRFNVPFRNLQITDMTCGARAAHFLFPGTACVLDVGCQSTRAVSVRESGRVKEFKTNDKCAAGAGGFIERAARYLEVKVEEIGDLSLGADSAQSISSVCAVLAESEIINHLTAGVSVENILRGIHVSLAQRALALLKRVGLVPELTFIGGVARQAGMVKALEDTVKVKVNVPTEPEFVGALGAALFAVRRAETLGLGSAA